MVKCEYSDRHNKHFCLLVTVRHGPLFKGTHNHRAIFLCRRGLAETMASHVFPLMVDCTAYFMQSVCEPLSTLICCLNRAHWNGEVSETGLWLALRKDCCCPVTASCCRWGRERCSACSIAAHTAAIPKGSGQVDAETRAAACWDLGGQFPVHATGWLLWESALLQQIRRLVRMVLFFWFVRFASDRLFHPKAFTKAFDGSQLALLQF